MEKIVFDKTKYYNSFIVIAWYVVGIGQILAGAFFTFIGIIGVIRNNNEIFLMFFILGLITLIFSNITRGNKRNTIRTISIDKDKIEITFFIRKTIILFKKDIYSYKKIDSIFYQKYIKFSCAEGTIRIYERLFEKFDNIRYLLNEIVNEKQENN